MTSRAFSLALRLGVYVALAIEVVVLGGLLITRFL